MHKKSYYIISGLIFFAFSFLFLVGFSGNALSQTEDEDKYLCQRCDSNNNCAQYWSTSKCTTSCSGCQKYTCKVCSNGSCSSKTFNSPCSDTCAVNSDCAGSSCYRCSDGQCRIYTVATGTCVDACSSNAQCVGSTPTTRDDRESGWNCTPSTETCVYLSNTNKTVFKTEARCKAYCIYCNACVKQYFGLWGEENCRKNYRNCSTGGTDACKTNADCQGVTTPPPPEPEPVRYSCNTTTWRCEQKSGGMYSALSTCQSNCVKPSGVTSCPGGDNCYSCNRNTGECYRNYNGGYAGLAMCQKYCTTGGTSGTTAPRPTTTTTVPPCVINKFELPKRAWVDIETTASWSTNNCDTAEINCISDDCIEGVENLSGSVSVGINQSKNFTIKAPGTYRYELEACGPNNCRTYEDVLGTGLEYIEIEALHLPWWEEIIPILPDNLQGFLRGIFRMN